MLNTFFIATIIVAGTNIANRASNISLIIGTELNAFCPKELAIINTAPENRKAFVSVAVMLSNPTIIPIKIRIISHVSDCTNPTPTTTASINPIKNAQLPRTLPIASSFFAIFTSFHYIFSNSYLLIYVI